MKTILSVAALLVAGTVLGHQALALEDLDSKTCGELQTALQMEGSLFLQGQWYVAQPELCPGSETARVGYACAADTHECRLGYTCDYIH